MQSIKVSLLTATAAVMAVIAMASCAGPEIKEIQEPETRKTVSEITEKTFKTVVPNLMGTVFRKVKNDGYAGAVEFCNENVAGMGKKATGKLQARFQKEYDVKSFRFGRTAHKLRNQKNAPNLIQEEVLERWLAKIEAGQDPEKVFTKYDGAYYGMVPLRINNETCLGCHGTPETIDPEAAKVINKLYPEDEAKNFQMNDLRGAFWVKVEM